MNLTEALFPGSLSRERANKRAEERHISRLKILDEMRQSVKDRNEYFNRLMEKEEAELHQSTATFEKLATSVLGNDFGGKFAGKFLELNNNPQKVKSPIQESSDINLGNPYWTEIAGLWFDEAFRRGFPSSQIDYAYWGGDEASLANNDTLRSQIQKICRSLFANHPHARGIVNSIAAFVCGADAWRVDPEP